MDLLRSLRNRLSWRAKISEQVPSTTSRAPTQSNFRYRDSVTEGPPVPTKSADPVACPYCGVVIDPPPARSRKCPSCKQAIVMRSTYGGSPFWKHGVAKTRLFLTQEQAEAFDAAAGEASRRQNAVDIAQRCGCSAIEFMQKETVLAKTGADLISPETVLLALLEDAFSEVRKRKDLQRMASIAFEKARIQYDLGRADFVEALVEHHRAKLMEMQASRLITNVAIASIDCCLVCAKSAGKTSTVASALGSAALPQAQCTRESEHGERGWCICYWSAAM